MAPKSDVVIIGGGVVGCLIARALSRYKLKVILVEKDSDVCCGASKANSAIIHAGYNAPPGSLKAKLNVAGNALFDQLCQDLAVPFQRIGSLVVATGEKDLTALEDLRRRGRKNGVPGLRIVGRDELMAMEPNLTPGALAALYVPTAGIVDPFILTVAAGENAVRNGAEVRLETKVLDFHISHGRVRGVVTEQGTITTSFVVNAAGLGADELAAKAGVDGPSLYPRRGEYYLLDKMTSQGEESTPSSVVNHILFPIPTPVSKGILVAPTVHGNLLLGPNAERLEDREDTAATAAGLAEVRQGAVSLVPSLPLERIITNYAGLRASSPAGDFVIEAAPEVHGFVNLLGIDSPGLSAAPAIAQRVVDILGEEGLPLEEKEDYDPIRPAILCFSELDKERQEALIERDPRYGRVVCRCEMVTEGEVVAAIHSPIPARTLDALKRRVRVGAGRCQGAFDTPRLIAILCRELGIRPTEVTKKGPGSELLVRETKGDWRFEI